MRERQIWYDSYLHTFPDDSPIVLIDLCRGRSVRLTNAPRPNGHGCAEGRTWMRIGFRILGIFPVPKRRCEPRGERVTAQHCLSSVTMHMIRRVLQGPAKIPIERRAITVFCCPVTTLAASVQAQQLRSAL